MVVEMTVDVFVASAEITDECDVELRVGETVVVVPVTVAREIAAEILAAADEAEHEAVEEVARPAKPFGFDVAAGIGARFAGDA